jgi:hypothetical protein
MSCGQRIVSNLLLGIMEKGSAWSIFSEETFIAINIFSRTLAIDSFLTAFLRWALVVPASLQEASTKDHRIFFSRYFCFYWKMLMEDLDLLHFEAAMPEWGKLLTVKAILQRQPNGYRKSKTFPSCQALQLIVLFHDLPFAQMPGSCIYRRQ